MTDSPEPNLQKKQDEFRRAWEEGQRPVLAEFIESTGSNNLQEVLQALIPIDIEYRAISGEMVDYNHYALLGDHAARIAAAYFSIDETPGPDAQTIQSDLLDLPENSKFQQPQQRLDPSMVVGDKYKLIQRIGTGGMGAVWLAQQEHPVRRRVAIKVVRADLGSEETISRFEAERQALAMMNHPNIAQVLDAGTLDDGSPFFVMELVKGIPLTRYCNENRLDIHKRLELLIPICEAIQHAHQKGIVHRDIKPSNILVSVREDKPVPKVIDFGLAKALEHQHRLTDQTMLTEQGRVVGTLQYMSPEQAGSNELDIDTRTDIYSLGVILYQLLTGSTPLTSNEIAEKTLIQIIGVICDTEIQRPSARLRQNPQQLKVSSGQRQIEPNRLIQLLQGELDWIALQALEKDRTNRYQTASSLADDLRRFLNNEPVLARPHSTTYLLGKFVRKYRTLVGSALLATFLLIGGICATSYYAIKANRQKNRADNQLEVYKAIFSSANPATGAPKGMSSYEILEQAEAVVNEKLADDPIGRAELLHQMGVSMRGLTKFKKAIHLLQTAFDLRREVLGPDHVDTLITQSELAIAYQTENIDKMLNLMKDVYERKTRLLPADSDELFEIRHRFGTACFVVYKEKKKVGEVKPELIDTALKIFEENYDLQKSKLDANDVRVLKTLTNLANVHLKKDRHEESIRFGKLALKGWDENIENESSEKNRNIHLTMKFTTKNNFAEAYHKKGDFDQAISIFKETLLEKENHYDVGHRSWRTTLKLLVRCMMDSGQTESGQELFRSEYEKVKNSNEVFDKKSTLKSMKSEMKKTLTDESLSEKSFPTEWLDDIE